jgi:hypothetical protein
MSALPFKKLDKSREAECSRLFLFRLFLPFSVSGILFISPAFAPERPLGIIGGRL